MSMFALRNVAANAGTAPMVMLEGGHEEIELMGMEREWAYNEPKTTEWLYDEGAGVALDGHLAMLMYKDRA